MSRSRKKTKIHGITSAQSEKTDKQNANRKQRRTVKQKVNRGDEVLPLTRETSDIWAFGKDGKVYDSNLNEKYMRK